MTEAALHPTLVVPLIGLPGAGKTTLATALAQRLSLRLVSRDAIRTAMFPDCRYSMAEKRASFRAVLTALEVNCALGEPSVLDGMTLARVRDRERVFERARPYGARIVPIWLDVPPHVARARVEADVASGQGPADRHRDLVDEVLERFETPGPETAAIDATLPPDEILERAIALLAVR